MNKCERKDGKLSKCHTYAKVCCLSGNQAPDGYITLWGEKLDFCPFCGADIRKPEEKYLIVKSGGTWVAHWKGVDYLMMSPYWEDDSGFLPEERVIQCFKVAFIEDFGTTERYRKLWKSFTGENPDIKELTDEIAKLRPMIRYKVSSFTYKLWGVNEKHCILSDLNDSISWRFIDKCRLATAHELREAL